MRYHGYPSSFSWSLMPEDSPQTTQTQEFIKTIHEAVRDYASGYNYWVMCSSPLALGFGIPLSFPSGSFLRSQFGYASGNDQSYSTASYTAMRRDIIDHQLPCIISGESVGGRGHAWICDGYHYNLAYWYNNQNEPIGIITTYLHYLWGDQDTSLDGWFSPTDVSLGGQSLQYNMRLTNHISPIDYWQ